ncbi:MAG: hypothetical protein EBY40_06540 [Marivivens sp.]|nr:hypothetical protein [Marivivens sp.]NBT50732.1 hypothetical protein [Marivivens sp.]NCW68640.1 hypothetical protein [Marivivens sp.]NDH02771.1 hypothetical protein [Marivivens sp.]
MSDEQVAEAPAEAGEAPSGNEDWRSALPPELSADPSLQHIGSVEAMAKSYINAQKMVGAEKVAIPGNWATDEDWDLVYNKMGRPAEAGDYELGEMTGELADWFRDAAHRSGLSARQAESLAKAYGELETQSASMSAQQMDARRVEIETELRQEFGDKFDASMQRANEMLKEFDAPDLTEIQLADGSLLGDNPDLVRFMVRLSDYVAEQVSEDGFSGRDSRPSVSEADLQSRISELTAKNSPYWEKMHPDHDRVVNEVLRARELLHGE